MLQLGLRLRTPSLRAELETDSEPRVPYKECKSSLDIAERCLRPMLGAAGYVSPLCLESSAQHACFPDLGKIAFHQRGKPAKAQV